MDLLNLILYRKKITIRSLYTHRVLNELADALLKVFIPIIIIKRTGSITVCIVYLIAYYLLQSLLNLILHGKIAKYPIAFLMLRLLPIFGTQILLITGLSNYWFVIGLIIFTALNNVFYWPSLNYLFATAAHQNLGSASGKFRAASVLGKMFAPVMSGLIIAKFDVLYVSVAAIMIYFASIAIIFLSFSDIDTASENNHEVNQFTNENKDERILTSSMKVLLPAYVLTGIFDTAEVFWAIYIYTTSLEYISVGLVAAFIQIGVFLSNLLIGKITDFKKWYWPAVVSLVIFAVFWFSRPFLKDKFIIFLISALSGFASPFFSIPVFSDFIKISKKSSKLSWWIALREVSIKAGGMISLIVSLLTSASYGPFILAGLSSIIFLFPLTRMDSLDNQTHAKAPITSK